MPVSPSGFFAGLKLAGHSLLRGFSKPETTGEALAKAYISRMHFMSRPEFIDILSNSPRYCRRDTGAASIDRNLSFRAVRLNQDLLLRLGSTDGLTAVVFIGGGYGFMTVRLGEYLTDAGYSITAEALYADFYIEGNIVDIATRSTSQPIVSKKYFYY